MLPILTFTVCNVKFCIYQTNNICVNFISKWLVFASTAFYGILELGLQYI